MRRILGVLALVVSSSSPIAANAALSSLSDLFVFGDSLSDSGNSGVVSGGTFPPPPYYNNQFSNGPVAVQQLWNSFNPGNTDFKASLVGGTNYSIGGATSGASNYLSVRPDIPPALQAQYNNLGNAWQLQTFSDQLSGGRTFDAASSLFAVWLFPNDLYYWSVTGMLPGTAAGGAGGAGDASALIANGVNNILYTVQTLAASGATQFLVPNMPDLGATPSGGGDPSLTALSVAFNSNLGAGLTALDSALPSVDIAQFDTFAFFNQIIADPLAYGFTNATDACVEHLADGQCDPSTWLFWDDVHPTTAAAAVLAGQFHAAVVPEPTTYVLLAFGLIGIGFAARRQQARG
ncbi:MAG: PEP-CTERM sorting domain-containing protein [Proteobacteria bacterium]|nr:PEP-CTERM sorting domain-containing protein [Pseudomonadota bacterium]